MTQLGRIEITDFQATGQAVNAAHFGANALHDKNTDADGVKNGFKAAADALNVTNFRYPGGIGEDIANLVAQSTDTSLAPILVDFMEWIKAENANGKNYTVSLVVPTKKAFDYDKMVNFARMVSEEYGDLISAIEIGNEYSIRSSSSRPINEKKYGQSADTAIRALVDGFDQAKAANPNAYEPKILLQFAEIFGYASSYKGSGNHVQANREIVSQLSEKARDAVDGALGHYYYNKPHSESEAFAESSDAAGVERETRILKDKIDAFNQVWIKEYGQQELEIHFTEWNVKNSNFDQLGLKGGSVMIKQFEYLLSLGVDVAQAWPLQHKTGNSLGGNAWENNPVISVPGKVFSMMSESLLAQAGGGEMKLIATDEKDTNGVFDLTAYQNENKSVIYVSSRMDEARVVELDLADLVASGGKIFARKVGYDPSTSNGLSENGDANNRNRLAKREITEAEYLQLATLPFFNEKLGTHIRIFETVDQYGWPKTKYITYLPTFKDIIPLVDNPKTISDYYFATETDVAALVSEIDFGDRVKPDALIFDLDPYEMIEITVLDNDVAASARNLGWQPQTDGAVLEPARDTPEADDPPSTTITGTEASESLYGTAGSDTIEAGAGNDIVRSGKNDDLIEGGFGRDEIYGNSGDDTLYGEGGDDWISSGNGNDEVHAGQGNDTVIGRGGDDFIGGGSGHDRLFGSAGNDTLSGHDGNDNLSGGSQNDRLFGGHGQDSLFGNKGDDTLSGQAGDDRLIGATGKDSLSGGEGNDTLYGNHGADTLDGGAGNDFLRGGVGQDSFVFGKNYGQDTINDFTAGQDRLVLSKDLWSGNKNAGEVIDMFAALENGKVVLDFGNADRLILEQLNSISDLQNNIDIF